LLNPKDSPSEFTKVLHHGWDIGAFREDHSDLDGGILSMIEQMAIFATCCFTAEAGRTATPSPESTSETSVDISLAVWETVGTTPARLRMPARKS
jgi:hypothetical protein